MTMDEQDRRLLAKLRENARTPVAQLARSLGLSRTTVQSRLARLERSGVIAHAIPYVIVNLVLWSIYFSTDAGGFPWPMFVSFFWGIGMASHFFAYWNKYGGGATQREEAIQREIEQERERSLMYEKPKHDARMRLTDDGELEEVPEDEISLAEKRKRN